MAAWAESVGWTLLITGILIKYRLLHGNDVPVKITGQIHGTFFLIYICITLLAAPSLRWSLRRTTVAALCSVPPYGSLLFEIWASFSRKNIQHKQLLALVIFLRLSGYKASL